MTREVARKLLSSMAPADADRVLEAATKSIGPPKSKQYTEKSTGIYNAVALPELPAHVLSVKEGGKGSLDFSLVDQTVWCSRNLKPPVIVEYVSLKDADEHDAKIAKELEKLRPKG